MRIPSLTANVFLSSCLIVQIGALLQYSWAVNGFSASVCVATPMLAVIQDDGPLTLRKIEELISVPAPDRMIATEIHKRGISFIVDAGTLESLLQRGAGPDTLKALSVHKAARDKFDTSVREIRVAVDRGELLEPIGTSAFNRVMNLYSEFPKEPDVALLREDVLDRCDKFAQRLKENKDYDGSRSVYKRLKLGAPDQNDRWDQAIKGVDRAEAEDAKNRPPPNGDPRLAQLRAGAMKEYSALHDHGKKAYCKGWLFIYAGKLHYYSTPGHEWEVSCENVKAIKVKKSSFKDIDAVSVEPRTGPTALIILGADLVRRISPINIFNYQPCGFGR